MHGEILKLSGDLEIIDINLLVPCGNNAKIHNEQQIIALNRSIDLVGYVQEICIDENNVILCGHGRREAMLKQGVKSIEVRRIKNLTESQKEQYRIMDNTTNSCTGYDHDILKEALIKLKDDGVDITQMAVDDEMLKTLDINEEIESVDEECVDDLELERDSNIYTYNEFCLFKTNNIYDIPELSYDMLYDDDIPIEHCIAHKNEVIEQDKRYLLLYSKPVKITPENANNNVLAFFLDDHEFQSVWSDAAHKTKTIKSLNFSAVCSPNFSLWADEPLPFNILAWYKTQWCARFWQEAGIKVIPTINYSTPASWTFCFLGIPKYAPVVIHQIRNVKSKAAIKNFIDGFIYAFETIQWKKCYLYGLHSKKSYEIVKKLPLDLQNTIVAIPAWTDRKRELGLL